MSCHGPMDPSSESFLGQNTRTTIYRGAAGLVSSVCCYSFSYEKQRVTIYRGAAGPVSSVCIKNVAANTLSWYKQAVVCSWSAMPLLRKDKVLQLSVVADVQLRCALDHKHTNTRIRNTKKRMCKLRGRIASFRYHCHCEL